MPQWATWETFRDLEDRGLTMYGQMTAGSWIYIGTQGILQGTYETLAARRAAATSAARLAGRVTVTAGLGGMGGAQPLAATMNEGVALVVEVDPHAHRAAPRDRATSTKRRDDLDDALRARAQCAATAHGPVDRAARQRRRRAAGAGARAASRRTSSPTRPPRTIR